MKTLSQRMLLEKDERVLLIVRKHWFILLGKVFAPVILMFVPVVAPFIIGSNEMLGTTFASIDNIGALSTFAGALWALGMWFWIFNGWTDWYLDLWTITNLRMVAIDQEGLFRRSISSFRYERLQDINLKVNGLIPTFLDFGTLEVQTAGHGESEFIFPGAPHPRETKAKILEAADMRVRSINPENAPNDDGV